MAIESSEKRAKRGFAAMSPEKQREIASRGGRAVQESGKAHRFTAEEAKAAGRLGGRRRALMRQDTQPDPVSVDEILAASEG